MTSPQAGPETAAKAPGAIRGQCGQIEICKGVVQVDAPLHKLIAVKVPANVDDDKGPHDAKNVPAAAFGRNVQRCVELFESGLQQVGQRNDKTVIQTPGKVVRCGPCQMPTTANTSRLATAAGSTRPKCLPQCDVAHLPKRCIGWSVQRDRTGNHASTHPAKYASAARIR